MTDIERKHTRIYAMAMLGLYAVGVLFTAVLVPGWQGLSKPLTMVIFGGVLMVVAIPFHVLGGKLAKTWAFHRALYVLSILLNLVGSTLCQAAYYTHVGTKPAANALAIGAVAVVGLCLLFGVLVVLFPTRFRPLTAIFGLITLGLAITCVVFWVKEGGVTASTAMWSFGFFQLVGLIMVLGGFFYAGEDMGVLASPWVWMRYLSFASFGLLLIVAAVVLLILLCASGDGCDCDCGGDCCDCGGSEGKKQAKNKAA